MKKRLIFALALACATSVLAGDTDVQDTPFISLTRSPKSIKKLPTNVSVITEDQIKQRGAKTLDEVIDLLPSVDVSKRGTLGAFGTVRLRAVPDSAEVQILIDDQPLNGVSAQSFDISQIPLENVERIEVVRGASSVLYGPNTIGGVINIITKGHAPVRPHVGAGFEARSFQTKIIRGQAGGSTGQWDSLVTVSHYQTDGFQENSQAKNISATATGGHVFDNGARLSLDVLRTDHEVGLPGGTDVPFDQWDGEKERSASNKTALAKRDQVAGKIRLSQPIGQGGRLYAMVFADDQDFTQLPRPDAPPLADIENRLLGGDAHFVHQKGFTLGAAYERDRRLAMGSDPHHATNWGVYMQEDISLGKLMLVPAARFDQHGTFGNTFNPRFTAVYAATDRWIISGNAARSFRAPSLVQLFLKTPFFTGNPDLNPEIAWAYDLGNEFRFTPDASLKVTGFYSNIRNLIVDTPDFSSVVNAPKAELSGAEVEAFHQIGLFSNRANYTFQRAVGNSVSSTDFVALRLTPRHLANWILTAGQYKGWTFTNTVQYIHKQFEGNDNTLFEHPSYTLWHIRLAKEIAFAEFFAGINNITDRRYAEAILFTRFPQPGRTYWGGLTVRFPAPRNKG